MMFAKEIFAALFLLTYLLLATPESLLFLLKISCSLVSPASLLRVPGRTEFCTGTDGILYRDRR